MNDTPNTPPSLDDVLERYVAEGPSYDTLNKYARQYPEYRQDLAELTVQWSAMEGAEAGPTPDDDSLAQTAIEAVRDWLRQDSRTEPFPGVSAFEEPSASLSLVPPAGGASSAPADSFEMLLEHLEIDILDFEVRSGLAYSVLVNLSTGAFSFASDDERLCIARRLLQHIRTFGPKSPPPLPLVERSISGPPRITVGASLSPRGKPEATTKPFRRGIEEARDMTSDAKASWLRLLDEAC